jgi:hypothetical protein
MNKLIKLGKLHILNITNKDITVLGIFKFKRKKKMKSIKRS